MTTSAGIDVGASMVKVALVRSGPASGRGGGAEEVLGLSAERIRRRDPFTIAGEMLDSLLAAAALRREEVDYVATTGDADAFPCATGHFFGMTTHARGALYLFPHARGVLDAGALHGRAVRMDARGKVLACKMTSQCASGSGQFLENIARYLGVTLEDVGVLSRSSTRAEKVSGVCAVLAETDVINMVSRGVPIPDILRGIHESMASRLSRLLLSAGATGTVVFTGGLSRDEGLLAALRDEITKNRFPYEITTHPDAIHAGAMGAALWGSFRHERLARARSMST
jgi:benzoyl-CoA reductase subunit D